MSSRCYHGPPSDHFDGERFFNVHGPTVDRGLADIWRWRRQRSSARWPAPTTTVLRDRPPARTEGLRIAMVGHASLLIQAAGCNILLDPVWSRRASPLPFLGPVRHQPPGIALADLPPIDAVLLTHSHYDHMDRATLRTLVRGHRPRLIAPLGNDRVVRRFAGTVPVQTADWWDRIDLSPSVSITLCPANHWSARTPTDRRRALWCGFVLHVPGGPVYLAGDTAFGDGSLFAAIRDRHAPTLAVLPIGAYAPRWFMASQHMNPEEAVRAFALCGAAQALGVHWGTFQLTDEPREAPPAALRAALDAQGLAESSFIPLHPGEVWPAP